MVRRVGEFDWARTPLGPAATWPESLRTLVSLMLDARQLMFLTWGPERIVIYNDDYAELLGKRHPGALGRPFTQVWPELEEQVWPILDRAYAGEPTYMSDIRLVMARHGYSEVAHFAFSYTPVRGADGVVDGMFCACTETTGEVRARAVEKAERERLRVLFAQAPGFMAVLSGHDHVLELVNDAYSRLVGKERDLIGRPIAQALPEIGDQGFVAILDEVRRTGEPFIGRNTPVILRRGPSAEPELRYVDFVFQPIADMSGGASGIFVQGVDVSEHVLAESALRISEERRRLAAEAARIGVWDVDLASGDLFLDEHARLLFGLPTEGALDPEAVLARIVPGERDKAGLSARERIAKRGGGSFAHEFRTAGESGIERWVASSGRAIVQDGRPARLIGTVVDITGRKASELRIAEIAERYRLAARATNDAIWDWDLGSDQVIWNRAVETLFGHAVLETSFDWWREHIHSEDRERVARGMHAVIEGDESRWSAEYRFRRADASYAFVLDRGYVLRDTQGRPQRVIGAMLDLSERRRAEERQALIQRELHHRVKNTLATVQAIAASSMRTAPSLEAFRAAFTERLISLGRTHTLLTENAWEGARLAEILRLELDPYAEGDRARFTLDGPHVELPSEMAVAFGMAVHELATNAAKHGALSITRGHVHVRWTLAATREGHDRLVLHWLERDGPPVDKPGHAGFGTMVLQRALAAQLQGRVDLDYAPDGLHVTVEAELPRRAASPLFGASTSTTAKVGTV